jgi:hypothetical protein
MARILAMVSMAVALSGWPSASEEARALDATAAATILDWSAVEDSRARFREIYCAVRRRGATAQDDPTACESELVRLAGEPAGTKRPVVLGRARLPLRVLVVPGLYGDCIPVTAFADALPRLEALGHKTGVIEVGGFSSVSTNARRIRDAIAALGPGATEPVVLVAYSKGVPDAMEALAAYPDVQDRVRAFVSVAGVVSGTPLADRIDANPWLAPLARLSARGCPERDPRALHDLGRPARRDWLSRNRLPVSLRSYSIIADEGRDRLPAALRPGYDLLAKFDPRNDGAVICSDAAVPGSKVLGFVEADHWAIALPFSREMPKASKLGLTRYEFPRDALLEAVIRHVEEDLLARR